MPKYLSFYEQQKMASSSCHAFCHNVHDIWTKVALIALRHCYIARFVPWLYKVTGFNVHTEYSVIGSTFSNY
jgi:hypothetical protein